MFTLYLLLPLFLLSAIGWLLFKSCWLKPCWFEGIDELSAKFLIPCLLFSGAYKNGFTSNVPWKMLLSFYIPLVLLFLFISFAYRKNQEASSMSLASVYSNTVFVGIPVLMQAYGEKSLQYAFPIIVFHSLISFCLYYMTSSIGGALKYKAVASVKKTVTNPIIVSLVAGTFLNVLHVKLPEVLGTALQMVSNAALPCALLAFGASLSTLNLASLRQGSIAILSKLIMLPLLVFIFSHKVFHLPLDIVSALTVLAASPIGVNVYVVVQGEGKKVDSVSSSILASSLLCTLTMPLWIWGISNLGLL